MWRGKRRDAEKQLLTGFGPAQSTMASIPHLNPAPAGSGRSAKPNRNPLVMKPSSRARHLRFLEPRGPPSICSGDGCLVRSHNRADDPGYTSRATIPRRGPHESILLRRPSKFLVDPWQSWRGISLVGTILGRHHDPLHHHCLPVSRYNAIHIRPKRGFWHSTTEEIDMDKILRSYSIALSITLFGLCMILGGNDTYALSDITFSNISDTAGINYFKPSYGNPICADFNNDGKLDVFVINHGKPPFLFKNEGNLNFTEVSTMSNIIAHDDFHGAAWGDYDNDGNADLFITVGADRGGMVGKKKDILYHNDGQGNFTNITDLAGVANSFGRGRSVNWVDYNNDGYLDLFLKNHKTPNILYKNNGNGNFTDVDSIA